MTLDTSPVHFMDYGKRVYSLKMIDLSPEVIRLCFNHLTFNSKKSRQTIV